jgi:hypothetical protein
MASPPSHRLVAKEKDGNTRHKLMALWPSEKIAGAYSVRLERGWHLVGPDGVCVDGSAHWLNLYAEKPREPEPAPEGGDDDVPF